MHKVNLNEYVRFNLTEKGYEILEKCRIDLCKLTRHEVNRDVLVKIDENGFEYMQTWEFMRMFGDHMRNGQEPIVENNNLYFD